MFAGKASLSGNLHRALCLRSGWIKLGSASNDPTLRFLALGANGTWTREQYRAARNLGRKRSQVFAHMPTGIEMPDIARIRAVPDSLGVAEQVVVVVTPRHEMKYVLVTVRESVLGRFWHAAVLRPNDSIADDPAVIDRGGFHPSWNPGQASSVKGVSDVEKD